MICAMHAGKRTSLYLQTVNTMEQTEVPQACKPILSCCLECYRLSKHLVFCINAALASVREALPLKGTILYGCNIQIHRYWI